MVIFTFTKYAEKRFNKLPKALQNRIINKLKQLKAHTDILSALKLLYGFEPATHRLRVGDYRLILELKFKDDKKIEFYVLDVGHRRDIYK